MHPLETQAKEEIVYKKKSQLKLNFIKIRNAYIEHKKFDLLTQLT